MYKLGEHPKTNKKRILAGFMASFFCASIIMFITQHASATVQCKVGSITVPSSTGNRAYTGVGFQPKALILFANRRSSDGVSTDSASQNLDSVLNILGFATSSSARATIYNTDDYTGGNPQYSNSQVLHVRAQNNSTPTTYFAADIVSMDADGFTLNFTTANATAYVVNYMALGGTDLSAAIKSFTSANSTGNQSQTGVGFQPQGMILIGGRTTGDQRGMGFISGTSNQGSNSANYGNPNVAQYQRNDKAYVQINGSTKQIEATLNSFDADGFTLNYTTADSALSSLSALCLRGVQFKAGSFTQKTSTGTQSTTGLGFQPVGLLTSTVQRTTSTSINFVSLGNSGAQIVSGLGASDGTNQAVVNTAGDIHQNTTLDRTKIYKSLADDGTPTVDAAASLQSFDVDGFTLNYTTADATAREIIYFAIGPPTNMPAAPTLNSPSNSATGVSTTPQFQLRTSDPNNSYLRYKIQVCSASDCSSVVRTIDQTSSQTGWSGQDTQSSTAYVGNSSISSSTMASHTYQAAGLSSGTQYWWRAYAIDPGDTNTFSPASSIFSFTTSASNSTPAAPTLIYPQASASAISNMPMFQLRTTDADSDYLKYFIQLYDASNCGGSQVGSDFDQTFSQTGWQSQDAGPGGNTAYIGSGTLSSSSIAKYQYSGTSLTNNHVYSWRAKAIDPGGSNSFSSLTSCSDFTTGTSAVQINGGSQINGNSNIY